MKGDSKVSPAVWVSLAVAGAFVLFSGVYVAKKLTRGIRNNNPGNLRPSDDPWQGQTGLDEAEGGPFVIFDTPFHGLRALIRTLYSYWTRHGLTTIAQIIARYAPKSENKTQAYIDYVAGQVGKTAWTTLTLPADLLPVARAIVKYENSRVNPYDAATWAAAYEAATR